MHIFIDDIRDPKDTQYDWTIVRNYDSAVATIIPNFDFITLISFDHDLGEGKDGYDIACVIEDHVQKNCLFNIPVMRVHSANPVGRNRLKSVIESIQRIAVSNAE